MASSDIKVFHYINVVYNIIQIYYCLIIYVNKSVSVGDFTVAIEARTFLASSGMEDYVPTVVHQLLVAKKQTIMEH